LADLLSDPRILKVGVGVAGDASKLLMDYNVAMKGVMDLSVYANQRIGPPTHTHFRQGGGNNTNPNGGSSPQTAETAGSALNGTSSPSPLSPLPANGANGVVVPAAAGAASNANAPDPARSPSPSPSPSSKPFEWSLSKLVAHCVGSDLPKPKRVRMSNWAQYSLTSAQRDYAALDALVGLWCYDALHAHHQGHQSCARGLARAVDATKATNNGTATDGANANGSKKKKRSRVPRYEHFEAVQVTVRSSASSAAAASSLSSSVMSSMQDDDFLSDSPPEQRASRLVYASSSSTAAAIQQPTNGAATVAVTAAAASVSVKAQQQPSRRSIEVIDE